jgi:uncharacterized MnhB-related membrane protein
MCELHDGPRLNAFPPDIAMALANGGTSLSSAIVLVAIGRTRPLAYLV